MASCSAAACQPNVFMMSSVQSENSFQSRRSVPSSAQMIGIGYCWAMSVTTSHRPCAVSGSTSSPITAWIVGRIRAAERGANALDTSRRSRWCSWSLTLRMLLTTRSHSGPEVMP